jgi:Raf kinase inhibitor-like YbhB/YbcL family protein
MTSYKKSGYHGPCPPFGTHRYYFKVYALDIVLDLEPGKGTKKKILKAIDGHILAYGELMGRYKRQK